METVPVLQCQANAIIPLHKIEEGPWPGQIVFWLSVESVLDSVPAVHVRMPL